MPLLCSAPNCKNTYENTKCVEGKRISFHRFPLNRPDLARDWLVGLKIENFKPSKFSRVCSDHFEEHCFIGIGRMVQSRLKEDAVPTIQVPVFTRDVLDCQILGATEEVWIPASVVGMDVESGSSQVSNSIGGSQFAYKEYVIPYISGFVVKMLRKRIKCPVYLSALTLQSDDIFDNFMFISFKNKGGLIKPSDSAVRICESTELFIQRILNCNDGALPQHSNNFVSTLTLSVVTELTEKNIFLDLNDHMLESTVQSNHVYTLMKCITQCFIKIRMHALARSYTEKITGKKVRKQLSKLVLFKHQ